MAAAIFVVAGILFQSLLLGLPAALLSVALVITCVVSTTGSWSVRDPDLATDFGVGANSQIATGHPVADG